MPARRKPHDIVAAHKQKLANLEHELVQAFDTLDVDSGDSPPLTELAALATLVDSVRGQQQSIAAGASSDNLPVERPSIASLAAHGNQRNGKHGETVVKRNQATMVSARTVIPDGSATIADAMLAALQTGRLRALPDPSSLPIATLTWDYPHERQITTDDAHLTTSQLTAALGPAGNPASSDNPSGPNGPHTPAKSLIAYGGICQPIAVDYNIPTFTSSSRPVKDGLPAFQATRGGINYTLPPKLSDTAGASGIWTEAMDSTGTATKPCLVLTCQPTATVLVHGVPVCVTMGNMQQRYNPELVSAWLSTTEAQAARVAELSLLAAIAAASTKITATATGLGAARELLPAIDKVAAGIRYRNRQQRTSPTLRTIMSDWVKDLLRADIAKELAHDNASTTNASDALALAESRLDNWFATRNINPIWALDDATNPFQTPAANWPATTTVTIFAEGTWVFLDGGRLDVGFIRDSTLNSTNDVSMFAESFEAVAFRGLESIELTTTLVDSGLSAGSLDTTAP